MAKQYQMVRVEKRTFQKLVERREQMERGREAGQDHHVSELTGQITMDTVINDLIAFHTAHRERVVRSKKKKLKEAVKCEDCGRGAFRILATGSVECYYCKNGITGVRNA